MPRLLLLCLLCAAADLQAAGYDPYLMPCYRYGRCDAFYSRDERLLQQRIDRLAPRVPEPQAPPRTEARALPPTPVEALQPAYRATGEVREEFRRSGSDLSQ